MIIAVHFFKYTMYQAQWLILGTIDRTETKSFTFRDGTVL